VKNARSAFFTLHLSLARRSRASGWREDVEKQTL
jgi:hypothetical protein